MKHLVKIMAGALLSAVLLSAFNARAQDAPIMALDPTLMAGWSGNLAYGNTTSRHPTASAKTNFAYTSSPALRQKVVATFAKRLQSQNPQGAQTITTTFGPGKADYGQLYQQLLKTSALHDNNAADALTGLMLTGYQIVNDVPNEDVTAAMERSARTQVAAILAKNPKMASTATRAQLSEELKLQTVLLALGWQETLKAKTQSSYRQSIGDMFQSQYHLDMSHLKLTTRGFSKK